MRDYEITLTIKVRAKSAEAAKLLLQRKLDQNGFDDDFRFDMIKGAMWCPVCGRNEIKEVRWSERYRGIATIMLDDKVCCSEDEGEFPTAESAQKTVDDINARLKQHAGLDRHPVS